MSEIPEDIMMYAERLYDEGGYKTVPTIISEAVMAERERCAKIADSQQDHWSEADWKNTEYVAGREHAATVIASMIRGEGA